MSRRTRLLAMVTVLGTALGMAALAPSASAVTKVYTATKTIPVPPSSAYAGGGGGDGWDLSMTPRAVYNVFHHNGSLRVACHLQATAEPCDSELISREILDADGAGFGTGNHSGTVLDPSTGRLFAYAGSRADGSVGVVCVDTTLADNVPNPFCGYDPVTPDGDAMSEYELSAPIRIGTRWYAVDYRSGPTENGRIFCFDLQTQDPCTDQPYDLSDFGDIGYTSYPAMPTQIGGKLLIPFRDSSGINAFVACFDPATRAACAGSWPTAISGSHIDNNGALIPVLNASGSTTGFCAPNRDPNDCRGLDGAAVQAPEGLLDVIGGTSPYNGQPIVLGDRVYTAAGGPDVIQCFDFGTGTTCPNFPRSTDLGEQGSGGYIYTLNPDPQRPECLWVNADYGSAQIQNFDAFTGGACGSGALRVLASSLVSGDARCVPDVYTQLKVLAPSPDGYESGSVDFLDGNGEPIDGLTAREIGPDGAVDLSDLDFTSDAGLPQFLISLEQTGETDLSAVTLELTWTGDADASCTPDTTVSVSPAHGLAGDTFVLGYSCPSVPSVSVTAPDGSPVEGVTQGVQESSNGLDYTIPVTITGVGDFVATVTCGVDQVRSVVFDTVAPVDGTMGPGWPQAPDGVDIVWSYGGGSLYRSSVLAGVGSWNAAVEGVGFSEWGGDATPVNVSFADVALPDDTYALTFFPDGANSSYNRLFVYLNPNQLDPASADLRTKVVSHELGHVLSLPDEDPASTNVTIMKQGPLPFSDPQPYDVNRVNARY